MRSLARQKNYQMIYHLACLQQCHSITWCSILFGNNVTTVSSQKNLRVLSLDLKGRIGLKTHMTRGLPLSTSASRGGSKNQPILPTVLQKCGQGGRGSKNPKILWTHLMEAPKAKRYCVSLLIRVVDQSPARV